MKVQYKYSTKARELSLKSRINILKTVFKTKGGHIGGSLSVVDIISSIYAFYPEHLFELILSKGHCILGWLSVLVEISVIPRIELEHYYENGSKFGGHPKRNSSKFITWSTGSLGHGLSVSCGKAIANKSKKFICILGDGETNEGSIWEALLFLSQHQISNLLVIFDNNKFESLDYTSNILGIEDLEKKLLGFNFDVSRINGHNINELTNQINKFFHLDKECKPMVIVADTLKGKGISFMENDFKWHHRKVKPEEYEIALNELHSEIDL